MELHAFDRKPFMPQAHNHAGVAILGGVGADLQIFRQAFFLDDQRVVARGCHGRAEILEDCSAIVLDFAGFAVHQFGGAYDFGAEGRADGLMSQAHSQHRDFTRKMADQFNADSGLLRRAWSGRKQDALRVHGFYLCHAYLVIPANYNLGPQFAQILNQVVGE